MSTMEQRVHVIPAGFEFDRIVAGLDSYGVSRIYLIRGITDVDQHVDTYVDRLKVRYARLVELGDFREVHIDIFDLGAIFKAVKNIVETEALHNQVFINLATSTKLLSLGLVMATWCIDASKVRHLPTLYYVRASHYVQSDLLDLDKKVQSLLAEFDRARREDVFALLQEVSLITKSMVERGSGYDEESVIQVPFMPIRLPSEFEMQILSVLENYGGEVGRIDDLVKAFESKTMPGKRGTTNVAIRSKISYHLRNLETRQLIAKIPTHRGSKIRITGLGKVFVAPRIPGKAIEE